MVGNLMTYKPHPDYASKDRGGLEWQKVLIESANSGSASIDAFGRWRVSTTTVLFDSKLIDATKQTMIWDESLESGAGITSSTPTAAKPYTDFTSTDVTAGVFTRQTFRRFNYQPGKSQLIAMTGVLELASGVTTGCERRIGYFDDNNGVFFESNAGVIGVTVRSNDSGTPVDTTVLQANWNLDNMDGDGDAANPSGLTVDWTQSQIFVIDFQWLGVGRVRLGIFRDGGLYYVHQFNHANTETIPWASTPNLPCRYQMITTASSGVCSMRAICAVVVSEGGEDPIGMPQSHATVDHVNASSADTWYSLLGVRLKTTTLGCNVTVSSGSVVSETADSFEWALLFNPTVAGTFTFSDKDDSCTQVATGADANTISDTGHVIERGFGSEAAAQAAAIQRSILKLGAAIDGTRDILVLAVRPLGANADIQGALNWSEMN